MQMEYYAHAIELTKMISTVLPFYNLTYDEEMDLPKRVKSLKVKLAHLNNAFLKKYEKKMDKGRIMQPYLVDDKLRKIKEQPKFVENGSVHEISQDNDIIKEEWIFTETCKKGKWHESKKVGDELNFTKHFFKISENFKISKPEPDKTCKHLFS